MGLNVLGKISIGKLTDLVFCWHNIYFKHGTPDHARSAFGIGYSTSSRAVLVSGGFCYDIHHYDDRMPIILFYTVEHFIYRWTDRPLGRRFYYGFRQARVCLYLPHTRNRKSNFLGALHFNVVYLFCMYNAYVCKRVHYHYY